MDLVTSLAWVALAFFGAFVLWDVARRAIDQRRREQDSKLRDKEWEDSVMEAMREQHARIRALESGTGRAAVPRPSLRAGLGDG